MSFPEGIRSNIGSPRQTGIPLKLPGPRGKIVAELLDYQSVRDVRRRWVGPVVAVLFAVASVAAVSAVLLRSWNRPRCEIPSRFACASNLRQIGQGVQMYANENAGRFPDDFETLLLTQDLTSEVFVCLHTNDSRADGPTTQAVAANLTAGGHVSYVYVGKGLTINSPPKAVVAYERLANHGDGMNVLFADGRVEWIAAVDARKLLSELESGHNPPRDAVLPADARVPAPATRPSSEGGT
jgi:prepilin-type processing-associated H-X9-DG protein